MASSRQKDAHVRARKALIQRVIARSVEWMTYGSRGPKGETGDAWQARMERTVARKLAAFRWSEGWGDKYSRYSPFGERQVVIGQYADVPSHVVHSIMCTTLPKAPAPDVPSPVASLVTLKVPIDSPPDVQRRVAERVRSELDKLPREYVVACGERFVKEKGHPCEYTSDVSQARRWTRGEASDLAKLLKARGLPGVRFGRPA